MCFSLKAGPSTPASTSTTWAAGTRQLTIRSRWRAGSSSRSSQLRGSASPNRRRPGTTTLKPETPKNGRPVYYVVEEPDSLHADRSPYNFEPADNQDSFTGAVADFTHSGVSPANQNDFVIKEHTYTMCPGCPTFSIPVPIPKASLVEQQKEQDEKSVNVDYQSAKDKNFLEKIGDRIVSTVKGIKDRTAELFDPILNKSGNFLGLSDDTNTISEKKGEASSGSKTSYLPIMLAGAAAAALGGFAFFAEGPAVQTINARSLDKSAPVRVDPEETSAILEAIEDAANKFEKQD